MKNILIILTLLSLGTSSILSQIETGLDDMTNSEKIDQLMQFSYDHGMFNGAILVSQNGQTIYKNALGYADKNNGRKLNESSVFYLASVSKQFTTMAIMILKEEKKLSYDDKLSAYFPEFPSYADSVTIRQLMTHTSGMPDHFRLGSYNKRLTNNDVLDILVKQKELDFPPGETFSYSNGGYVLLSLIVEKVTKMPFPEFMHMNIFKPLGMKNTLVYTEFTPEIENRAVGYNKMGNVDDYGILTTGAGGMYSTLADLNIWDQALYSEKLVTTATLEEAFTSAIVNNGQSTGYGYGWIISENDDKKTVLHSGGLAGYRTLITRNITNKNCYILLTNHGEASLNSEIALVLDKILAGEPYELPKIPISNILVEELKSNDITTAIKNIHNLLDKDADKYDINEKTINKIGYVYLRDNALNEALAIFKLNVDYNPLSANVYDSYAEAQLASGDTIQAIENYKKSLELNGNNANAIDILKSLNVDVSDLSSDVKVSKEILQQYVGEYELAPTFKLTIILEGDRLFIQATGQDKSEVFASSENRFYSKIVDAQFTFNRDKNNKIISLTLHQNGNHEAPKIK